MTTENHRRNPRDDAHVRRLCALRPDVETALGLLDHQHALPTGGVDNKAAVVEANVAWRRDLEAQASESRERLLDARVFAASLELFRFADENVSLWRTDPDVVGPIAETLLLHLRGLVPVEPELRFDTLEKRLRAVRPALEAAQHEATSTLTTPSPELIVRARDIIDGMPDLLRAIGDAAQSHTASTGRPLPASLQRGIDSATDDAATALEAHREWLIGLSSVPSSPIGAERFDELLRLRGLDLTSSEVVDLGRSIAEELRVEQARLLQRGFKGMREDDAVDVARKNVPHSLSEALAWSRELVDQARSFLHEQGAVPVVSADADNAEERLHIDALPAALAPWGQSALYLPPQPYAPRHDALLLLREPLGPQQEALRELSVADLETVVAANAFPGRHVQAIWQCRTTSIARRGALFGAVGGPASTWGQDMVAGWSLVAAELMRELHFRHSPASRLLMLRQAQLQTLLAVVDVGLGIGTFGAEPAAAFLVRRGGVRLPVARALVRSLLARPTSGLSGLVGKVRIEQLRREAHRRWRDGYSDRRFNTLLLVNGPVPLAYLFERLDEPPAYVSDVTTASYGD
ncbi:MAG TPA: DUF885 family protein [Myxococcota bacterium]